MAICICSYLEVLENNPDIDRNETLGQFINSRGYSQLFQKAYLVRILSFNIFSQIKNYLITKYLYSLRCFT